MLRELNEPTPPVSEQAAAWFFELADGPNDPHTRREFSDWLKRSPENIDAFLGVAMLERELSELPADLDEVLAQLDRSDAEAIPITIRDGNPGTVGRLAGRRGTKRVRRSVGWLAAAGVAALLLISGLFVVAPDTEQPAMVHRTDFGEQRSIALSDGSIVILNTRSEIAVRFNDAERQVDLISGEALFDVAHDSRRPFVVDTGTVAFRVLGTKFSVYRKAESVHLAVIEGTVRAVDKQAPETAVLVGAGEGAVATADGTIRRNDHVDIDKAIAWTERRLVFDDARLADVISEFNRYNRRPLVVEDPELAERKITSVFFANDVTALTAFLELEPDVDIEYGADAIRIRSEH